MTLFYDDVKRHYVTTNVTRAMPKKYVCKVCNTFWKSEITPVCDQTCSDCLTSPPCAFSEFRYPCDECKRHFRIRTCFAKYKQCTAKRKSVCENKRCCATCGILVTHKYHEYNKRFCAISNQNRDIGHLCYMRHLKDVVPSSGDKVLYVFYDFETTENKIVSDKDTLNVPELVWVHKFCLHCENA